MEGHQRFSIEEIAEDGQPIVPIQHARLFVNQCGAIVRDTIPITIQEWNKPKKAVDGVSYVDQRSKDLLWETLMAHFNLPPEYDEIEADGTPISGGLERRLRVKEWALKKMAEMFRNHKKRLHLDYVAKNKTPEFKGPLEKIKDQWPKFVAYKKSQKAVERSVKIRQMLRKSNITMLRGQVATRVPCLSGKLWRPTLGLKGSL